MHETQPVVAAAEPLLSCPATPGKLNSLAHDGRSRKDLLKANSKSSPDMKTRQLPSTTTTTASFRAKQWDAGRMPAGGIPCERERKHEVAKREREEQLKRERAMAAAAAAAQRVRQHRRISADREQAANRSRMAMVSAYGRRQEVAGGLRRQSRAPALSGKAAKEAASEDRRVPAITHDVNPEPDPDPGVPDSKADRLRIQLEELAKLPEQEFEQGFRQWLDQEGIAREMHSHLRVELINCFNNTALGQLLNKAAGLQISQSHALLHSPLALALPTLVAEFLHSQNCHFTLSVFCSEMPHRHTLPKFENRPEFRFRTDELQQVLGAVLGGGGQEVPPDAEFKQLVEGHYLEDLSGQTQSLLMALMRSLVEIRRQKMKQEEEKPPEETAPAPPTSLECATQTEPAACLEARPEVDTSRLYQAEESELILGADGRSVFVGPRVSQSLHSVEEQMSQLMKNLRLLTKSCAPPVEVISEASFEQLIHRELRERDRLTKAGQTFDPGEPVIKLPPEQAPKKKKAKTSKADEVVQSDLGPIILPADEVELPRLLPLHPEQFSSLAVIRQSLDKAQRKTRQPQGRMYVSVQRLETLMSDVCGCVQLLGNVLNLSMEQEHAVGQRKGFEAGYKEGFGHGHFMGVQEGRQKEQHDRSKNKKDAAAQVQVKTKSTASQATRKRTAPRSTMHTQTEAKPSGCDATSQVDLEAKTPHRSYEQWIHEMLHSSSGQVFLERVELSLNKALELQKQRLDELYLVKLRHQAEMFRLSRRQSSWRTLCKRVERDSQSSAETQDLVKKIFHLLEHYESHHHLLAEKIQQTELAAEQATCIVPMWAASGSQEATPAPAVTSTSSEVSKPVKPKKSVHLKVPAPVPAPSEEVPPHPSNLPYPGLGYSYQLLAVAPPGGIVPVPTAYLPVDPRLAHYRFSRDPGAGSGSGSARGKAHHSAVSRPSILPKSDDAGGTKDQPIVGAAQETPPPDKACAPPVSSDQPSGDKDVLPSPAKVLPTVTVPRDPVPPKDPVGSPTGSGSAQALMESLLEAKPPPGEPPVAPCVAPHVASSVASPVAAPVGPTVKPSVQSVATNTMEPPPPPLQMAPPILSISRPSQGPSFEEALLSAKTRMKQLEEESDLLEQSFLTYLEKAKCSTNPPNSAPPKTGKEPPLPRPRRNLKEHEQQLDSTVDSLMDWHRRVRLDEAPTTRPQLEEVPRQPTPVLDSKVSSPLWLSELEEGHDHDHDQDKYHFTNAISEARKKLLGEIGQEKEQKKKEKLKPEKVLEKLPSAEDWVPAEMPKVLSVVRPTELSDITPSRSSSNGEMSLLLRRAKEALGLRSPNPLLDSSSDSSSLEASLEARSPSQKLQQSMAKMELLFGGASSVSANPAKPPPLKSTKPKRTGRPLSAPTTGTENLRLPQRPHTAPTLYPIQESQHSPDLETSTTSTSQAGRSPVGSFEALIASAVMGPDTTPEVSFSQEFWKRMNL